MSIKDSKVKENSARHGRATGVHGHAPRAETCLAAQTGGWPAVRGCMATRASLQGRVASGLRVISRFLAFLFAVFSFTLEEFSRLLSEQILGEN